MFEKWKEKRAEKKAKNDAIAKSQYWKDHALLRSCLQAMRGSCTLAPVELHEAAIAVVNIAMQEDNWNRLEELIDIPGDFFGNTVFIVWNDEKLPVLKAPWVLVEENLADVRAVADQTFLVCETMDRIIWFDRDGRIRLYSLG